MRDSGRAYRHRGPGCRFAHPGYVLRRYTAHILEGWHGFTDRKRMAGADWADWQETAGTLHLWTQIVGKVRLRLTPIINHWWGVVLYVNSRGLTTSAIPYGRRTFDVSFDFIDHVLRIDTSDGGHEQFALAPMSVAAFYAAALRAARRLGIDVHIWPMPVEIPDAIPFTEDRSTPPTTPRRRSASGRRCCRATACSRRSARVFSARRARCISSGAASISR